MPEGKAPPIGRYRNLAVVLEWRDIPDTATANVTPGYVEIGKAWCSLKAKGDMFIGVAQVVEASGRSGTHVIRTRFREDLSNRHMLEIAGLRYRVVSVRPDDARRFVELEAELYGDATVIGARVVTNWDAGQSTWDAGASEWDR